MSDREKAAAVEAQAALQLANDAANKVFSPEYCLRNPIFRAQVIAAFVTIYAAKVSDNGRR